MPYLYYTIQYQLLPKTVIRLHQIHFDHHVLFTNIVFLLFVNVHVIAVLYQFHLYNLSHLLSVALSDGIFLKPLTHDLIVQTVKMITEREKLSSFKNPSSVTTQLSISTPSPTRERDLSMLLCNEVSTMASSLLSKFESYLVASDFAQNKCSNALNISWIHSTGTSEVERLGLELKRM